MVKPRPILYAEDEPDDVYFIQRAFHDAGIAIPPAPCSNALSIPTKVGLKPKQIL